MKQLFEIDVENITITPELLCGVLNHYFSFFNSNKVRVRGVMIVEEPNYYRWIGDKNEQNKS